IDRLLKNRSFELLVRGTDGLSVITVALHAMLKRMRKRTDVSHALDRQVSRATAMRYANIFIKPGFLENQGGHLVLSDAALTFMVRTLTQLADSIASGTPVPAKITQIMEAWLHPGDDFFSDIRLSEEFMGYGRAEALSMPISAFVIAGSDQLI